MSDFPPFWRNFVGSNKGKNAGHHIIQNGGTISNGDIMSDVEHTTEVVDDQETDQVLQQVKLKKHKSSNSKYENIAWNFKFAPIFGTFFQQ